jgi:small-conductance mechanosensitive channel
MFKRGSLHLLSRVAPALFLVLSAPLALATQSAGKPAAAPAAHAPTTPAQGASPATQGTQATSTATPTTSATAPVTSATASATAASATATAVTPAAAAPMTGPQVIELLDKTIDWYRTLGIQQQAANEPSDLLILYDNRQTANQVLALAFEIARANAEILAKEPQPKDAAGASTSSQSLSQLKNKFATQSAAIQTELDSDRGQLAKARPQQRTALQAKISELQGELDLINARKSLLATMSAFTNQSTGSGSSASALKAEIDAMAVTVPSSAGTSSTSAGAVGASASTGSTSAGTSSAGSSASIPSPTTGASGIAAARFGVWDLAANVVRLSEKASTIDVVDRHTEDLQGTFTQISAPLIDQLKGLSARGDALAAQADAADNATLDSVRGQLDALSAQYKQTSVLLIPLSKVRVLLNQYRRNLGNWHSAIKDQYHNAIKTLGVRLGVLAVLLAVVFGAAEFWRHAVMRYIQEPRRRYQFLLLRKIALWSLVVVIVGFAFASELGSIVTFAGLITAGIAVAMQSVLVSIVGYFFLIGKYGIRVGDRVQIGDVTGEVIELGLVRLHLMELAGHGSSGPTGRVVAFPNSIAFQVSSGLFKQIRGVDFVWREMTLSLPAGIDYAAAKEKLNAAVMGALKDDSDEIARQSKEIQKATASTSGGDAQPRVQLSFSATGAEARIRYPVHLRNAAEIDERVSQSLFAAMGDLGATAKSTSS